MVSLCYTDKCTKRSILSDVSRFFDPLRWATPVLIFGRIFLQDLWRERLEWDEPILSDLRQKWLEFAALLAELDKITVPRYIGYAVSNCLVHLLGFSDASEKAFAATVYLTIRCEINGEVNVQLLIAKSKVAPLKAISIPRLELCGAVLLARLMKSVSAGLGLSERPWRMWSDAQVVLRWLNSHPSRWSPYVAHRVSAIHDIADSKCWNYIPTHHNPTDLATRGITPDELAGSSLWWHGPEWLRRSVDDWPVYTSSKQNLDNTEEVTRSLNFAVQIAPQNEILMRFSVFNRLLRIIARCLRFVHNARNPRETFEEDISIEELEGARLRCIRLAQIQDFFEEMEALKKKKPISFRSRIRALRPVLTDDGILRVGSRLPRALISEEAKQPLILAKSNHLSLLLTRHAHKVTLHGGPLLMQSVLSEYWIVHSPSLARQVARQCVTCVRYRGLTAKQQMGPLPLERVTKSRPFFATGVDFASPFCLTAFRDRGCKIYK